MPDRENVILALELCRYDPDPGQEKKWYHSCLKCPYCTDRNGMEMNCAQMYTDAIALLREQGAVEPHVEHDSDDDSWYYGCGACHEAIDYKDKFCRHCGREVKWDADD